MKPTTIYRRLWPNTAHDGSRTRHHDQCPSKVSFRTADPRQSNPATYKPSSWMACCAMVMLLLGDNTSAARLTVADTGRSHGAANLVSRPGETEADCLYPDDFVLRDNAR